MDIWYRRLISAAPGHLVKIYVLLLLLFPFVSYTHAEQVTVQLNTYENKTIGVRVSLPEKWTVYTDAGNAPDYFKASLKKKNGPNESPLFVGNSANNQVFSRLLCETFKGSAIDYFDLLYASQKDKINIISARYDELTDSVQWIFTATPGPMKLTFQETITKKGDYVLRLGFWTLSALFEKYKGSFDDTVEKTLFLSRENAGELWENPWKGFRENRRGKDIAYVQITKEKETVSAPVLCEGEKRNVFWAVKGRKNTIYLFGSIHLGKPEFYPLAEKIESSFGRSKHLVVEVDITSKDFANKMSDFMSKAKLEKGKSLKDVLLKAVYDKLVENVNKIGLPMDSFQNLRPWAVALVLESMKMQSMGYVNDFGVDKYFLEKARDKKSIIELETLKDQINLFERLGQEKFLAYTMLSLSTFDIEANRLILAWRCGDLKTLEDIIFDVDKTNWLNDIQEVHEKLFFDRNKKMVDKIKKYLLDKDDYFVVVGTGHLIGDKGIVALLKNAGYKVNRF